MANNNLKLQIITALDNAGLKATEQQLKSLESSLGKVNNSGTMGKMNNSLIKMPGMFGKISESLGGIGTKLGVVYAGWKVFTESVNIGHKIFKQFGDGAGYSLESIGNGFKDLGKQMKSWLTGVDEDKNRAEAMQAYKNNEEALLQIAEKRGQILVDKATEELNVRQRILKNIHDETTALIQQAKTQSDLKNSSGDAKILMMTTAKDMLQKSYRQQGYDDYADQIGYQYDIMIAKERAYKQTAEFDAKLRQNHISQQDNKKTIDNNEAIYNEILLRLDDAEANAQKLEGYRRKPHTLEYKRWKSWNRTASKLRDKLQATEDAINKSESEATSLRQQEQLIIQQGANLAFQQQVDVRKANEAYDDWWWRSGNGDAWMAQNAHAFNADYNKYLQLKKQEDDTFIDTADYMLRTAEATEQMAQTIEQVFQLKGY